MSEHQKLAALDAELMVLAELMLALVQSHPNPKAVHLAFLNRMESLIQNAPSDVNEDYLVEVRARMAQMNVALQTLTRPT